MIPLVLTNLADKHARGLANGTKKREDVVAFVAAMKGSEGTLAAAYYIAALVSRIPESTKDGITAVLALRLMGEPKVDVPGHVPTIEELNAIAAKAGVRVVPDLRPGAFNLYWPDAEYPGGSHAFAVSIRDAIETIKFNIAAADL